jgi:predicted acylesterase/phospholipase RssA
MTAAANDTFYIGFALSGAISAGAYTAGVLDFFFQALNEWEKAREVPGTPGHRVDVQVVTGASAGAITGALGVVALARGMRPQKLSATQKQNTHPIESEIAQDLRCVLRSLYETWVTRPRLVDPNGGIDFLSTEDLERGKDAAVVSALNAELLDRIKENALLASASGQAPEAQPPYAHIAENLHVYMTVSNLRGIPFTVSFGNSTYGMQTHGDRVHYTISGLGNGVSTQNAWVCTDASEPLAVCTLPPVGKKKLPDTWDRYGTCALASSAFPIGLAPREIAAPISGYKKRSYPIARGAAALEPDFPKPWLAALGSKGFVFLNVDGGLINNNPFDYAQYALMGDSAAGKTGADDSDRAVIMVSPFPEPPAFLPDEQPAAELVSVIRALFPALIDQSRFKTAELVPAMDPDDHSRFLIAPHRNIGGVEQRYKIACGLLGGFGGFLDEDFRPMTSSSDDAIARPSCVRPSACRRTAILSRA